MGFSSPVLGRIIVETWQFCTEAKMPLYKFPGEQLYVLLLVGLPFWV